MIQGILFLDADPPIVNGRSAQRVGPVRFDEWNRGLKRYELEFHRAPPIYELSHVLNQAVQILLSLFQPSNGVGKGGFGQFTF